MTRGGVTSGGTLGIAVEGVGSVLFDTSTTRFGIGSGGRGGGDAPLGGGGLGGGGDITGGGDEAKGAAGGKIGKGGGI